jgi:hypothetical protein
MSYDPESLTNRDKRRMMRIVLGWWWYASLGVPAAVVLGVLGYLVLGMMYRTNLSPWASFMLPVAVMLTIVPANLMTARRRHRWNQHAYAVDGRICVMCGYTLDSEHDGKPCPECGAKADLARYRRLWIEFAGGWKHWPVELEKAAAKTSPKAEGGG